MELGWLHEYLAGLDYPISRADLVRAAEEHGAPTEALDALRSLPLSAFDSYEELTEFMDQIDLM